MTPNFFQGALPEKKIGQILQGRFYRVDFTAGDFLKKGCPIEPYEKIKEKINKGDPFKKNLKSVSGMYNFYLEKKINMQK